MFARGPREMAVALLSAAVLFLAVGAFDGTAVVRGLETASLDLRFRLRGPRQPGPEAVVVLVDDASLAALGRWPFSRHLFADAVRTLDRDGAKVIVFDMLFAEPDSPIPPALRQTARDAAAALGRGGDASLGARLLGLASDDADGDLAAALQQSGKVLLPFAFSFTGAATPEPDSISNAAYAKFDKSPVAPVFPLHPVGIVAPLAPLAAAAAGLGHVNIALDRDGAPRYDYVALPFEADFLPSMAVRATAAYLGVPWSAVGLALGQDVQVGPLAIPTDAAGRLLINYRGPRSTIPTVSFVDLVQGRVPAAKLSGRIVILGASFIGNSDANASPFGSTPMPGSERIANIIDTILARDFIAEDPAPWPAIVPVAVLLLAALAGAGAAVLPTRAAALPGLASLALWAGSAQAAFLEGLWLPVVQPAIALAGAMLSVLLFRYAVVDREGRHVKRAFHHYLAPDMVDMIAANPERLKLGGETRTMTMLFCDVRGFTAISEGFKENPQGLTRLINRLLTPLTDVIMARRGTIDKYMGDCIMAFWNAPLDDPRHADHACESALAMMQAVEALNREIAAEADHTLRPLAVGIGINTGDCVVGNMGSQRRFDYSVLGDAVNLASRLEGQSKTYGAGIVIGETTRAAAPSWAALELDRIAVKGKSEAVRVYALLGDAAMAQTPPFQAWAGCHDAMLAGYRAQDWDRARAALAACRDHDARLAPLYALYEERIEYFLASPPGPDWDGVFVAHTK